MPGAPPRMSTSIPESSATAAHPLEAAACRAFNVAFARKVDPVSAGEGRPSSARLVSSNGNPASKDRNSRSLPELAVATTSFLSGAGGELCGMQLRDALRRKVQQLVEFMAAKRVAFCGALDFDKRAAAVHDDIHVGFGVRILRVVQIKNRRASVNAHRHGSHLPVQRVCDDGASLEQSVDGIRQSHEAAGNRCGARAAVGLQHIAIDGHGALSQSLQIDDRAQRAADQALNLLCAAGLLAASRLACRARMGRARQHAVFGGHPALTGAAQESRHTLFDAGGAQDPGCAETHQHGAFGVLGKAALEFQFAQFVGGAPAGAKAHAAFQRNAAALVLSLYGAEASTAWVPKSINVSRSGFAWLCAKRTKSWSFKLAHNPSVHSKRTSPALSLRREDMVISGRAASPPRQHST